MARPLPPVASQRACHYPNHPDDPDFPDYYGRNLDDCLADTDVLVVPALTGLAATFEHLDTWLGRQHTLLDIWAGAARYWSLFGRRIVVLVCVTDTQWTPPTRLGATRFWWQQ